MNTASLTVGIPIKDYTELCNLLGIEPKPSNNTNGRKAHHREFERYFSYTKQGRRYIINEIYEVTKVKSENRGGNNMKYKVDFRNLMISMLHNDKSENILISKGSLYEAMNLVNKNYKLGKQNIDKLSKVIEVPKEYISDFYGENNKKIRETTERNLKALRKESLLMFDIVTAVAVERIDIQYNELGTPIVENGRILHYRHTEYRKATKEEKQVILACEKEAKCELGFSTDKDIFSNGAWGIYSKLVKTKLKEAKVNINFYYKAYEITWNRNEIEKEYNQLQQQANNVGLNELNDSMIKSIKISSQRRHITAKKADTNGMKQYKVKKIELHSSEEYVKYSDKITSSLIYKGAMRLPESLKWTNMYKMELDI